MNTLEALLFPGTTLTSARHFPLLLLFRPLSLLLPVEPPEQADSTADIFTRSAICQAITPCPLGDDRQRFLQLIADIRNRKDDYAAQLSALTLAAMTRNGQQKESEQSIIATLLGGHRLAEQVKPEDDRQARLWQARLVLKIAEILDEEEEDLGKQLALLDDQQDDLFKRLHGQIEGEDEEDLVAELEQLRRKMSSPDRKAVRNRLNAWKQLLMLGEVPNLPIWLTTMPEAADLLLEDWPGAGGSNKLLCTLALPAHIGWTAEAALARIEPFRTEAASILTNLAEALAGSDQARLEGLVQQWQAAIEQAFPTATNGRCQLRIYDLRPTCCAVLLGRPAQLGDTAGSLLAVLDETP